MSHSLKFIAKYMLQCLINVQITSKSFLHDFTQIATPPRFCNSFMKFLEHELLQN